MVNRACPAISWRCLQVNGEIRLPFAWRRTACERTAVEMRYHSPSAEPDTLASITDPDGNPVAL
jgi:hypothetical protein